MADIVTELRNDAMRFWLPNSEARRRSTVVAAADEIVRLRALLGNAVGAVIDSGGYCEGPHDVAAAIYRLTAERDSLRALVDDFVDPGECRFDHHGHCQEHFWFATDPACPHKRAKAVSAVGGAPGVSETHTDPKEAPRMMTGVWPKRVGEDTVCLADLDDLTEPQTCLCPIFRDTGGFRIADLGCPIHGVGGTDPGDGPRRTPTPPPATTENQA